MTQTEALRSIYKTEGRDGLVRWVAAQRAQMWMQNANHEVIKRHIGLFNRGEWPKELDPPDWRDHQTFEALRSWLSERLLMAEAADLSPELQHLAGKILSGALVAPRKPKKATASTPENISVALGCIIALEGIGIPAHVSKQWRTKGTQTGCEIVAEGLGLRSGEESVIKWWKAYRRAHQAAKRGGQVK